MRATPTAGSVPLVTAQPNASPLRRPALPFGWRCVLLAPSVPRVAGPFRSRRWRPARRFWAVLPSGPTYPDISESGIGDKSFTKRRIGRYPNASGDAGGRLGVPILGIPCPAHAGVWTTLVNPFGIPGAPCGAYGDAGHRARTTQVLRKQP